MPYKVRNITTQSILSLAGEPYGILICKTPNVFLVDWIQQKSSRDISKFLIRTFTLPFREEASPPVVWTMMFMLWHVLINYEDMASDPYSSTLMNITFLSWFINVVTRNFGMSRCGSLLLDGNPNGYEVAEHIASKVELNPRMLSTLKNEKFIWSMNPEEIFDISVVGPLVILVALVKRQIGQGSSNSGRFSGRPSMSPFIAIRFSRVIETWPKTPSNKLRESLFWKSTNSWETIFLSLWGLILKFSSWR